MRNACFVYVVIIFFSRLSTISSLAQTQAPPPQTARQALIEMFLSKNPDAFTKHLPAVASKALIHKGDDTSTSIVQRISTLGQQLSAQGHVETFDVGPNLLLSEHDEGKDKIKTEVTVEGDNVMGESEEIEVSIHVYRDGELEFLPVIPRLIFSMTQEKEIWKLTEVVLAAHVPLTDPDYLKGVRKEQDQMNENMASARVSVIASTETQYASAHPDRGYSCNMSELFGNISGVGPSERAGYNSIPLPADDSGGYHFSITGCSGSPVSKFQVLAVPTESDSGMKTFCSDESGAVRFEINSKGASCLSHGQPVNANQGASMVD
jgi:hypothetical protein